MPASLKLNSGGAGNVIITPSGSVGSDVTLTIPASTGTIVASDSSGNVGIGISSPSQKLEVQSIAAIKNSSSNVSSILFTQNSGNNYYSWINADGRSTGYISFAAGDNERMRIDSNGYITTPSNPMFRAYCNQNNSSSTQGIIPFNNTSFNVSSSFNTSTYTFTAPVAGKYLFAASVYVQNNTAGYANVSLRVNGSNHFYAETDGSAFIITLCATTIISLSAGDTVTAYYGTTTRNYYRGSSETNFSGFLVG